MRKNHEGGVAQEEGKGKLELPIAEVGLLIEGRICDARADSDGEYFLQIFIGEKGLGEAAKIALDEEEIAEEGDRAGEHEPHH
jgi:hypothetical protein